MQRHVLRRICQRLMLYIIYSKVTIYGIGFVISLFGNLLVIATTLRKSLVTPFTLAIAHVALCDILFAVRSVIEIGLMINDNVWKDNDISCKLTFGFTSAAFLSSTLTMTLIALERRNKVVKPLSKPWSYCNIIISSVGIWVVSFTVYSPYMSWLYIDKCGICTFANSVSAKGNKIYLVVIFLIKFIMPFIIMGFCYISITVTLYKRPLLSGIRCRMDSSVSIRSIVDFQTRETKRVVIMLLCSFVAFTVMTIPSPLYWLVLTFSDKMPNENSLKMPNDVSLKVIEIFATLHYLHSGVNPLIYLLLNKTFRKDSIQTLKIIFCRGYGRITPGRNSFINTTVSYKQTKM